MNRLIKYIKQLIKRKPKYKGNYKGAMAYAFTCGGVDYFMFADAFKSPYKRLLLASHFQDENIAGVNSELLGGFLEALEREINSPSVNLNKVDSIIQGLKNKISQNMDVDSVMKIASTMFIDSDEDAYDYSVVYSNGKIKRWQEYNAPAFFLTIQFLMQRGLYKMRAKDLKPYLVGVIQKEKLSIESLKGAIPNNSYCTHSNRKLPFLTHLEGELLSGKWDTLII